MNEDGPDNNSSTISSSNTAGTRGYGLKASHSAAEVAPPESREAGKAGTSPDDRHRTATSHRRAEEEEGRVGATPGESSPRHTVTYLFTYFLLTYLVTLTDSVLIKLLWS